MIETLTKLLGVTGAALGIFYLLYRQIIEKIELPGLTKKQAFNLLVIILFLIWSFAIFLIVFQNGGVQLGINGGTNISNNNGTVHVK